MLMPALAYQSIILSILLALLGLVLINMRTLPDIAAYQQELRPPGSQLKIPRVAILVPARNEEANIEACLLSLLSQDYPDYEVWLYDDASGDATASIAAGIADADPRLHVVRGEEDLPPGWLGKAHACHRLYLAMQERSDPDYLLFTDADVRHEPAALSCALAAVRATGAGLLSMFPRQITLTWAERLAVPVMQHWAVYGILPLPLAFSSRTGPAFSAANGQFMLFAREAYRACGGHAAVRAEVLEDVALARAVKRSGHRAILADGGPLVRTRMYAGPGEVWSGYSKNTYAFFGYSPLFLGLGVAALAALYVVPPLFVLYALATGQLTLELFYLPITQYAAAALARLALSLRFAYRPLDALLHPISILVLLAIVTNSMLWGMAGRGAWKGRRINVP
jgi:chlorobactene glucosyltransferase